MKQLNLEFLLEEIAEPAIALEQRSQEELVSHMATAIIEVHKEGGENRDD